ncbi:MAG: lactonase family protein [Opitutaceae bacterium]|nr:lactonase family protein [Opitutaceae bacterium]MBP9912273.1 lactonase family protein [Opitutaceae bacterium]
MSLTATASEHLLFIGTYTRSTSQGIYAVRLNAQTGALSAPELAAATTNPSFLALAPGQTHLYAVSESSTMAVPFATDLATGQLTPLQPQASGGTVPCHLVVDRTGRTLIIANYHTGVVASLPIRADGTLGPAGSIIQHAGHSVHPSRQESPHVHSVTLSPDNRFVIVCDLGLDKIFTYALDPAAATLTPASVPFVASAPGAGPRHAAFSPDGRHVFVINELGSTLVSYRYDAATGALTPLDTQSTLPADFQGESSTAEVRVHPNGRFVYGSNRGHDSIAVFACDAATGRLTLVEHVPTGGKNPRNFTLSPDGAWLVAANQNSDSLRVFRVDAQTGRLQAVAGSATVPMPVCVLFAR